jgi:hypothetical protein
MRKWSIAELESIEFDLMCITGDCDTGVIMEEDARWLKGRINIREMHGTKGPGRCDSCGNYMEGLTRLVEDHSNAFDGPCELGLIFLCMFCR